jgi:hypothetical protein
MRIILATYLSAMALAAQNAAPPAIQSGPAHHDRSNPWRDPWQKPDQVIAALNFSATESVAVIEDGYPYFAPRIAPHVAKVYAVNSDPRALSGPREKSALFTPVVSSDTDPHVSSLTVDTVILVDVLHLLAQRDLYLQALATSFRSGARLVIIGRKLPAVFPTASQNSSAFIKALMAGFGFRAVQEYTFLSAQYFLVFQR